MKIRIILISAVALLVISGLSCKKELPVAIPSSSLTIVNAFQDSVPLIFNFDRTKTLYYFKSSDTLGFHNFRIFGGYKGKVHLGVYGIADSVHTVCAPNLLIADNSIHTLFLAGNFSRPDTLFTTDNVPKFLPQDSSFAIRFVNFIGNKASITVNLQNDAGEPAAKNLDYGVVTPFQPLSVKASELPTDSYTFEFRDAGTGDIIFTYTLSTVLHRQSSSVTLVLNGLPGHENIISVAPYYQGN